ncbi:MAG: SMC-Scp complex subunit ScpB [Candidatus Micrarchaeota archaeon]|nr:SMC-Scp complex subunit ScpB [Candidatus Micrarchaeota archaeon]MDE1834617.1 SMC-Scp complex subunit ScpB [Candidatus Micrarchaeota archaeon]MDE1859564.1 SMC-Scp complex subunit ScpB [Candidatus Micrarchaeota archaeon]
MPDEQTDHKRLIEAALFMSPNAMSISEISSATGIASPGAIERMVNELISEYEQRDTALKIMSISGKFMFSLKDQYIAKVSSLATGPDISRGALRILAYIGKNEQVLQSELVKYFGTSTYDYIKELTDKEFIQSAKYKRSKRICTTPKFKEYFSV